MILAIDTATARAVIALGPPGGDVTALMTWLAGYRHGEELLARLDRLLADQAVGLGALEAIVVGTGPGAFTGLRVGLSVAKTLAHELAIPLVGISTASALRAGVIAGGTDRGDRDVSSAGLDAVTLVLPAGPASRYVADAVGVTLVQDRSAVTLAPGAIAVAVDLDPAELGHAARERGDQAVASLGGSLLRLGHARLEAGLADDPATLVPEYVALPRGAPAVVGEVAWSRDRR